MSYSMNKYYESAEYFTFYSGTDAYVLNRNDLLFDDQNSF